jgi:uncharacterized protein
MFGAFGLTTPTSAAELAVTMVHEFQHSKLSALLDLVPLTKPGGGERLYAPWKPDPRPASGLLQGVYAFLAVADAWHRLREVPALTALAEHEFAHTREQVNDALQTLCGSERLTPAGERFAAGMRATMDRLMAEPVPRAQVRRAVEALAGNRRAWLARNGEALGAR